MYWPSDSRNRLPVVALLVETASTNVPSTAFVIFATSTRATAPVTSPPPKFVNWNFSGTVEPSLKMLDPSPLTGWSRPPYM